MKERYVIALEVGGLLVLLSALVYSLGMLVTALLIVGVGVIVGAQIIKQG